MSQDRQDKTTVPSDLQQSAAANDVAVPIVANEQFDPVGFQRAIRQALASCHSADAHQTRYGYQSTVELRSLIEVLIAKGIIGLTELEARKRMVSEQVAVERSLEWAGPQLHPTQGSSEEQQTPVLLDCATRVAHCGAACCSLFNVFLTAHEVTQGRYLWDLANPYRLLRGPHGHCAHLDPTQLRCTIWDRRPYVCRQFSCANDSRIWQDFDKRVVAEPAAQVKERNEAAVQLQQLLPRSVEE